VKRLIRLVLTIGVFALVAAGCGSDDDAETAATTAAPAAPATDAPTDEAPEPSGDAIKFGFLNGLSGDYSPWGQPSLVGAEVAIDEINAEGGVLGRPVELVVEDNKSTVEGAVSGYTILSDVESIDALGGVESDGAIALLDTVADQEIPTMCPACGSTELDTKGGDWIFRITASDTDGGIIAAQFARDRGFERVAILVQQTEGTLSPAEIFQDVFENKAGGEIIDVVRFDPGRSSYQAEVEQAFSNDPDAVYLAAGFEAGIPILREWERRAYGGTIIMSPDLNVPEISALSGGLENGVALAAIAGLNEGSATFDSFSAEYEERTGNAPSAGLYEANQYDQYIVLALAMTAAGTTDGPAVRDKILEVVNAPGTEVFSYAEGLAALANGDDIDFQGASSSLDLNEFGNLLSPSMGEMHIIDGEWTQVATIAIDPALRPS
jgi:branched-chain amino acid transport system substrate-binding protein